MGSRESYTNLREFLPKVTKVAKVPRIGKVTKVKKVPKVTKVRTRRISKRGNTRHKVVGRDKSDQNEVKYYKACS